MTALIETTQAQPHGHNRRFRPALLIVGASPGLRDSVLRRLSLLREFETRLAGSAAEARSASVSLGVGTVCIAAAVLPDGNGTGLLAELRAIGHLARSCSPLAGIRSRSVAR